MKPKKHGPQRTCRGCRKVTDKKDLLRYALKNGQIVIDWDQKMEGRGAYTHRVRSCIEKFLDKKQMSYAFSGRSASFSQKELQKLYSDLVSEV